MKTLHLLAHEYPGTLRVKVGGVTYTYKSSEFFCQRFLNCYSKGARFNALNWFKRVAKIQRKEVTHER